jgi:hypothetical protein
MQEAIWYARGGVMAAQQYGTASYRTEDARQPEYIPLCATLKADMPLLKYSLYDKAW